MTWSEQPTNTTENAVTNRSSVGGSCAPTPMTWDITTIAKQWATDVGNYGLVLMSPTERAARNHRVYPSSEDSDFNDPPKLTATFSPVGDPVVVSPAGPDGVEVFTAPEAWKLDDLPVSTIHTHALDGAYSRAHANANTLAPPYFDPAAGQVVAPATSAGKDIAGQVLTGTAVANGEADETIPGEFADDESAAARATAVAPAESDYSISPRAVEVINSYQALNAIIDQVLDLDDAIPAGDKLFATHVWPERNLVVVQSTNASPELRRALADRYGTNNVAIWLRSETDRVHLIGQTETVTAADNRQSDIGKVNGGSKFLAPTGQPGKYKNCTTGFSMGSASDKLMVTAGHCLLPQGGDTDAGSIRWSNWQAPHSGRRHQGQSNSA